MDLYQDALASYLTCVDDDERQFVMDSVHVLLTAEEVRKRFGDDTPNPSIEYTKCQMDAGTALGLKPSPDAIERLAPGLLAYMKMTDDEIAEFHRSRAQASTSSWQKPSSARLVENFLQGHGQRVVRETTAEEYQEIIDQLFVQIATYEVHTKFGFVSDLAEDIEWLRNDYQMYLSTGLRPSEDALLRYAPDIAILAQKTPEEMEESIQESLKQGIIIEVAPGQYELTQAGEDQATVIHQQINFFMTHGPEGVPKSWFARDEDEVPVHVEDRETLAFDFAT